MTENQYVTVKSLPNESEKKTDRQDSSKTKREFHPILFFKICRITNNFVDVIKDGFFKLLIFICIACVIVSVFQTFSTYYGGEDSGENNTEKITWITVLEGIGNYVAAIAALYMCKELTLNKEQSQNELTRDIIKNDMAIRKKESSALADLEQLGTVLDDLCDDNSQPDDFNRIYTHDDFSILREYVYHYEFAGYAVKKNLVNFSIMFDTVTFQDNIVYGEKPEKIIKLGKKAHSDFWDGILFLYSCYQLRRKYNAYLLLKREKRKNIFCCISCYFTLDKSRRTEKTLDMKTKKENLNKDIKNAKKDLLMQENVWYHQYSMMP